MMMTVTVTVAMMLRVGVSAMMLWVRVVIYI